MTTETIQRRTDTIWEIFQPGTSAYDEIDRAVRNDLNELWKLDQLARDPHNHSYDLYELDIANTLFVLRANAYLNNFTFQIA